MDRKPRHLWAIEAAGAGQADGNQISIEDGIREGIKAGRLTPEVGAACLDAYHKGQAGELVNLPEPEPPEAA